MNRRGFLQMLGLASAALTLDPEKLLWVPGQKAIFLPTAIVTPDLDAINQLTMKYITPGLVDAMWQRDTLMLQLANARVKFAGDAFLREHFIYDGY
jgi:hypothetical protein